ncbi:MAG: oxygen-insensitive NADPH nitroreductase [Clostridiaceae bacterium]
MNETITLLKNHRSIRHFKDYPISEETLIDLIEAGQSASTSNFAQAYTIINVKDIEKRKIIAELSGNQQHIIDAPLFLVFVADLERARLCCEMNGEVMDAGSTEAFLLATIDTALMAQNMMTAAESMQMGGVFIGAIRNNPELVSTLLELPKNTYPVFGMCLGYPDQVTEQKPRLPLQIILKENLYDHKQDEAYLKEYDAKIVKYYGSRSDGKRTDSWTKQLSRMFSKYLRPHMKSFLESKNLDLK